MAKRWGTNLSINGSVVYDEQYQRDLQYEISIEAIGSCKLEGSPAFMWTVVLKRLDKVYSSYVLYKLPRIRRERGLKLS